MNERIKELAEQAGVISGFKDLHPDMIKFADLIRQDEAKACAEHYLSIMRDAVEQAVLKEREACAKLCEDSVEYAGDTLAKAIRARRKG